MRKEIFGIAKKDNNILINEDLKQILNRMSQNQYADMQKGLVEKEIEYYCSKIKDECNVEISKELQFFLSVYSNYYFGSGIKILGKSENYYSDIILKTKEFKSYMEDWECDYITEPYIVVATYNNGEGFVFYYENSKKYIIADYAQDYDLGNIDSLVCKEKYSEVLLYLEKLDDEYFKK